MELKIVDQNLRKYKELKRKEMATAKTLAINRIYRAKLLPARIC